MTNLISNSERATYNSAIDDIHDTFSRDIIIWRQSAEVINSTDQNYDAFNNVGVQNTIYTSQSKIFKARIKYIDRQDKEFALIVGNSKIDITQEFQLVRIKIDSIANAYFDDCEKVTIDGIDFLPITTSRPHGLFTPTYYTIYLRGNP